MLWLALLAMAAIAAGALAWPLLRRPATMGERAAHDLAVYRDQMAEIERDLARGVIAEAEARAARIEIARRMLAADAAMAASPPPKSRSSPRAALAVAAIAPIAALGLYVATGSPWLQGQPFAARSLEAARATTAAAELAKRAAALAERLATRPDDRDGWALLARTYSALARHGEAAAAWRRAVEQAPDNLDFAGEFGAALVQANDGVVGPEALAAFERVLAAAPFDPRASFYKGLARAQAGAAAEAVRIWTDLLHVGPSDAPWAAAVRAERDRAMLEAKIDLARVTPSPAAEAARAAQATRRDAADEIARLPQDERIAAIRAMVEGLAARLEAAPDDVEGWRRLGRAWRVLGENDKAAAALKRATALAPARVDVLVEYAEALYGDTQAGDALPPAFVATMRTILTLAPEHGDALWFVGLAEAEAGNAQEAAKLWTRLLPRLPAGSPERAEVEKRLAELKAQR